MRNEGLQPIKYYSLRVYIIDTHIYRDSKTINPHLCVIQHKTYDFFLNLKGNDYWVLGPIIVDLQTVKTIYKKII